MKSVLEKTIDCKGKKFRVCSDGEVWKLMHNTKFENGYYHVHIRGFEPSEMPALHILVAQAFISNPENKPEVHHIDGNPANNDVSNLMWVTSKEHADLHPDRGEHFKELNKSRLKPIRQKTNDGKTIRDWESAQHIKAELGYNPSNVSKCCRGLRETAYGCRWEYISL